MFFVLLVMTCMEKKSTYEYIIDIFTLLRMRIPELHELELLHHMLSVLSFVFCIRNIDKEKHKLGDNQQPLLS